MKDIIQLENIVNGKVRKSEERRVVGQFSFPVTTEHDLSFALKLTRVFKPTPINKIVDALAKIGKDASWINDEDLKAQASLSGSPLKHMRGSIQAINRWLAKIKEYVQLKASFIEIDKSNAEKTEVLVDPNGMLYRGGISTMLVLAGDEISIAPMMLTHAVLANASAIVKPSRIEPLGAYLFTRALIAEGITPPSLLYISSETEAERELVKKAIKQTQQSVILGEDHTVQNICEPFGFRAEHKTMAYLTGRSGAIVWPDADIKLASEMIIRGATDDRGNRCNSTKKVFAPRHLAKKLEEALVQEANKLVRGEPTDENTDIGRVDPQSRTTAEQWTASAKVFYDRDMFLMTVPPSAQVLKEELPYPAVAICYYDEEDPVALANESVRSTPLGETIAMSLFTGDYNRFMEAASRLLSCKVLFNRPSTEYDFWTTHQR